MLYLGAYCVHNQRQITNCSRVFPSERGGVVKKESIRYVLLGIILVLITYGCASTNVYLGKIVGKSSKANLLSLEIKTGDEPQTISIHIDNNTKGIDHAVKGYSASITYEKRGDKIYAVSIKPELTSMPQGVTEISVAEVKTLIDTKEIFELIDSRPVARYSAAHLPGAVSLPMHQMQDSISMLPKNKSKLLVFYCGGPI